MFSVLLGYTLMHPKFRGIKWPLSSCCFFGSQELGVYGLKLEIFHSSQRMINQNLSANVHRIILRKLQTHLVRCY